MTPESVNAQKQAVDSVIRDSLQLAKQLGNPFTGIAPLQAVAQEELPLFCYAAFGESGVGKTTLLSRLAGESWETLEDITMNGCVRWNYTGSPARWKKTQPGGIIDRYVNIDFFKTAAILDSGASHDKDVIEQAPLASAQADVIFLLFSADNPFCPETWKLADRFQTNEYRNVVIVLTKFQGSSLEAGPILDRLREISYQRWNFKVPAAAFITTSESEESRSLLNLEKTISSLQGVSPNRGAALKRQLSLTSELLQEVREVVQSQVAAMNQDGGFLQQMEHEIDYIREKEASMISPRNEAMAHICKKLLPEIVEVAAYNLGYYPSIIRIFFGYYKKLPDKIDELFISDLEEALEERLASYDKEFIEQCRQHWNSIRPKALAQLNCEIGEFPGEELAEGIARQRERVGRTIYKPLSDLHLKIFLTEEFHTRENWLRALLTFSIGALALGSIMGVIGIPALTAILWIIALLLWLLGIPAMAISRKNMRENAEGLIEPFAAIARKNLYRPLEEAALCNVAEYRTKLTAIHSKISITKETLEPIRKTLKDTSDLCFSLNYSIK